MALAVLAMTFIALAVFASPAFAARSYESQILGPPPGAPVPGPFAKPWAVFVDKSDNIWVSDTGNGGVISKFDPSGTYLSQVDGSAVFTYNGEYIRSIAVNHANGNLYAADSGPVRLNIFDSGGNFLNQTSGEWGGYVFVAVDNSGGPDDGSILVAGNSGTIDKFNAAGNPTNYSEPASYVNGSHIVGTPERSLGNLWTISTDSEGNIYVVDRPNVIEAHSTVDEYASSGKFIQEISQTPEGYFGEVEAVAVDPTNGNILVADTGQGVIHEFTAGGEFIADITGAETPAGSFSGLDGIAVNSQGRVYVGNWGQGVVDVFSPDVILPKVTYPGVSALTRSAATLRAHVDPASGGDVIACHFDYGTTSSYGSSAPCNPDPGAGPGSNFAVPTDVDASISGLTAATTYHYRVVVSNANGTKQGADRTFDTAPAIIDLATDPPSEVSRTAATLNGSFTGDGTDTHYYFEWGTSTAYGETTAAAPGVDAGSPTGALSVSAPITGLEVYTPISPTYHYRIVATNSLGTTYGPDRAFHSLPPIPPEISSISTSASPTSAQITAQINPGFGDTVYFIQYGAGGDYETATGVSDSIGNDDNPHGVSNVLSGLTPGTTYHFRIVAVNFGGTTHGADRTFSTPDVPRIDTSAASAIGQYSATLEADVFASHSPTTYHFEYGVSSAYGSATAETGLGDVTVTHRVTAVVAGLSSGTIYHYRMVATNGIGTAYGPDQVFTTQPVPGAQSSPLPGGCKKGYVKRKGACVRKKHKRHPRSHQRRSRRGGE